MTKLYHINTAAMAASLSIIAAAGYVPAASAQVVADAGGQCTLQDFQPIDEDFRAEEMCGCDTLSEDLLNVLRQRADFLRLIAETGPICPEIALLLTDVAPASMRDDDERYGDPFSPGSRPRGGGGGGGDTDEGQPPLPG